MDVRRTVLSLIFVVSVFLLWESWMRQTAPTPVSQAQSASQQEQVSGVIAQSATGQKGQPLAADASVPVASANLPAAQPVVGVGPEVRPVPRELIVLENPDLRLKVDPLGGRLVEALLLKQPSKNYAGGRVQLFQDQPGEQYEAQTGLVGQGSQGQPFPNHTVLFEQARLKEGQDARRTVVLMAEAGGMKLMKTISLDAEGYKVRVAHTVMNTGADAVSPSLYLQLMRHGAAPVGESFFYTTFTGPALYTDARKFEKVSFETIAKGRADHARTANDGWVAMVQHYFVSAWVVSNQAAREFYTRRVADNLYAVGFIQALPAVAPGAQQTHEALLYVGPQQQQTLESLAPGLDLVVDYGWLTFIAKPIYWLLEQLYKLVFNWGWAIVLLTILIKLAFYPLSAASYRSMAKMKAVAPRMTALRERYENDKAKFNQAMMELYKTEKINPLGGCLPIVVQIPVFISLYWVLLGSVEMRNAPWILWIHDLSAPDALFGVLPYLNLPLGPLPILMGITMFIQTKLNPPPPDPIQAKVMMFMPLVFSITFFFFPSGLVLYWLVNNIVSIAQQWVIMKRVNAGSQ